MRKFTRLTKFLFVSIVAIFLFVACDNQVENKENKKLETIDVILDWYPNSLYSFIYTAIEKGYFEKEGIEVKIHFPANASDPIALTAAKKADVGFYYLHSLIMARINENVPVKAIGTVTQKPLAIVMALKENNINRPKDLEEKTIGYSGGPLAEGIIDSMIKNDGGNPEKVKVLDIGFELLSGMITKQVDATIGAVVNHEVPVMIEKGFDVNYFYPSEYGIPSYYETILIANEDFIKEKKDLYTRFLKACVKGAKDMKNNPEKSVEILLENQVADQFPLSKNVEMQGTNILLSRMFYEEIPFLHQDEKVWQENIDWMYNKGLIKSSANAKDMFENIYEQEN